MNIAMRIAITFTVASLLAACATYQDRLDIDVSEVTGDIPSLIYGAGAEDVNHEIYGGLYDQRIFGESMEEPAASNIEGFSQYDSPWACENDILFTEASHCAKIISVSGGLEETNTPDNPESVIPKESVIRGKVVTFAPYSYNMVQIATDVK